MKRSIVNAEMIIISKVIQSDPDSLLSKVLRSVVDNKDPRVHFETESNEVK
jgi:hypothetical protein